MGHPGDTSEESLCWNQFSWFFFFLKFSGVKELIEITQ